MSKDKKEKVIEEEVVEEVKEEVKEAPKKVLNANSNDNA